MAQVPTLIVFVSFLNQATILSPERPEISVAEVMVTPVNSAAPVMHSVKVTVPVTVARSLKKVHEDKAIIAKITIDFIIILFEDRELLLNLQKIYRKIKIKNGVVTLSIRRK